MRLKVNAKNAARALTEDGMWRVFAYGSLKTGKLPVLEAIGELWLRPTGQAAVYFGSDARGVVRGEVIEVDTDGLIDLDMREGIRCDPPFYNRILLKLRDGTVCWAYEWARPYGVGFTYVCDGVWEFDYLRVWRPRYGDRNVVRPAVLEFK